VHPALLVLLQVLVLPLQVPRVPRVLHAGVRERSPTAPLSPRACARFGLGDVPQRLCFRAKNSAGERERLHSERFIGI